jgi:hypothetical protein
MPDKKMTRGRFTKVKDIYKRLSPLCRNVDSITRAMILIPVAGEQHNGKRIFLTEFRCSDQSGNRARLFVRLSEMDRNEKAAPLPERPFRVFMARTNAYGT